MEQGLSVDQVAPALRFALATVRTTSWRSQFRGCGQYHGAVANLMARGCASKMKVHAVTSKWNMTVYDPYVNMLRGTTEAMSAAVSGVHSIEVRCRSTPYENRPIFSARIARNAVAAERRVAFQPGLRCRRRIVLYRKPDQSIAEQAGTCSGRWKKRRLHRRSKPGLSRIRSSFRRQKEFEYRDPPRDAASEPTSSP